MPTKLAVWWQLAQLCATAAGWFMVATAQVVNSVVEWQASHGTAAPPVPIGKWLAARPSARTPSWQAAQLLVTPTWVNIAPAQLSVVWQASHSRSVTMCVGPLPCAIVPLWQVEQLPRAWVWSKLTAGFQAIGVWQASHWSVARMWLRGFAVPRTAVPTPWQAPQSLGVPWNMALTWQDSQGRSRCWPVSSKPVVRWSKFAWAVAAKADGASASSSKAASTRTPERWRCRLTESGVMSVTTGTRFPHTLNPYVPPVVRRVGAHGFGTKQQSRCQPRPILSRFLSFPTRPKSTCAS